MLGLHFFMPAHLVPLVEVVLGGHSSAALGEALSAFMRACGQDDDDLARPKVGIVSTHGENTPCSMSLGPQADAARLGAADVRAGVMSPRGGEPASSEDRRVVTGGRSAGPAR